MSERDRGGEVASFKEGDELRKLVTVETAKPAFDYTARAGEIFDGIRYGMETSKLNRSESLKAAYEAYVMDEDDPAKHVFADVILRAPQVMALERHIGDLSQRQRTLQDKGTDLSTHEMAQYKQARRRICEYRHEMREMVAASNGGFTHEQLEGWIDRSVGGNGASKWAQAMVRRVQVEVASREFLQTMPGVREVRFTNVDEELRGDSSALVMELSDGRRIAVAAFAEGREDRTGLELTRGGLRVGLSREAVSDFALVDSAREPLAMRFAEEMSGRDDRRVAWTSERAA